MRISLCALWLWSACGEAPVPVDTLVGEVTIHQFPGWTHGWAVFLAEGRPRTEVTTAALLALPSPPSRRMGSCDVSDGAVCKGGCPGGSYCYERDVCRPYVQREFIDTGPIVASGGKGNISQLDLTFQPDGFYLSSPLPGPIEFFRGGEPLVVTLSSGQEAVFTAPTPMKLRENLVWPQAPAVVPLRWEAAEAEVVVLKLVVSSDVDPTKWILARCLALDGGEFQFPADLIASFPASPRSTHLEVTRDKAEIVSVGHGDGVLVHIGHTFVVNARD